MIRQAVLSLTLAGSLLLPAVATAQNATIWCTGTVARIYLGRDGDVVIYGTWRNDYTKVCNLLSTWNGINTTVCTDWYATLLSAYTHQKPVTLEYDGSSYTCDTLPTYGSTPVPDYVMANWEN